jgi:hypothetical protein
LRSLLYVDPVHDHRGAPACGHERVGATTRSLCREDADLNLRIALAGRFLFRDAVVALNRRHRGNQTRDLQRFHTRVGRARPLLRAPRFSAGALAARALAYSNLDAEHGLQLGDDGRWREAAAAFAAAVRGAPNPARVARILVPGEALAQRQPAQQYPLPESAAARIFSGGRRAHCVNSGLLPTVKLPIVALALP